MSFTVQPSPHQFTVTDLYVVDDVTGEGYAVKVEESLPPLRRTVSARVRQVTPGRSEYHHREWVNCTLGEWSDRTIVLQEVALMAVEVYFVRLREMPPEVTHPDRFERLETLAV